MIGERTGTNIGIRTGAAGYSASSVPEEPGTNIYVDQTLGANITNGTYSIAARDSSGTDGNAYTTIQGAIGAMSSGDNILLRGGTYLENVLINALNGVDGTSDNYSMLASYNSEWGIIDGQNNQHYTVGKPADGRDTGNFIAYWKFERLEITGGTNGTESGAGLYISGGPFQVRYCKIHTNQASLEGENPSGISGYGWIDSVIEYNWFDANGLTSGSALNAAHIALFTDYDWNNTGQNGYDGGVSIQPCARNEIRYNHFSNTSVGIKHKGSQLFTGRNPGTADFDDTYKTWGDHWHHNYFNGSGSIAAYSDQDFNQIYQNIFDGCDDAIVQPYQPDFQMYKVGTWNNTIINPTATAIVRYGCDFWSGTFTVNPDLYGFDYNNIIDQFDEISNGWSAVVGITIYVGCGGARTPLTSPSIANYTNSHNYFYRPDDGATTHIFRYGHATPDEYFNQAEFEANAYTGGTKVAYQNVYDAGNLVYEGTTGSAKYRIDGTHLIEGAVTLADGGKGGAHPDLAGITIPSYLGAANPSDDAWVDGVVTDLASVAYLTAQLNGSTPSWKEAA